MSQSNRYTLACAFDEDFALPAAVALRSVSMHWTQSTALDVYIIDGGVSPRSRSQIEESIVKSRRRLHWCSIDLERFLDLPLFAGVKRQVYDRLALGEVIPEEIERVVYLDMDVLALRCISELWTIELNGNPIAAVQDMAIPRVSSPLGLGEFEALGLSPDTPYFNNGLLVLEMKPWREEEMAARLMHYLRVNANRIFHFEQHAFNALCAGRWCALDPRWNVIASLAGRRYFRSKHLSRELHQIVSRSPWILHFAGTFKPWRIPLQTPPFSPYRETQNQVSIPAPSPGWYERTLSIYYLYFRGILYPLERLCWILRYRFLRG